MCLMGHLYSVHGFTIHDIQRLWEWGNNQWIKCVVESNSIVLAQTVVTQNTIEWLYLCRCVPAKES
jgi:carbonic anhydrase/acetyltransferase-like protein (isoleucine patch superfamily)